MSKTIKKLLLFFGDLFFLHIALFLTLLIRYQDGRILDEFTYHWPNFSIVFFIWILIFYILDLYNLNLKISDIKFVRSTFNAALISVVLSVVYFYLIVKPAITPKTNLVIFSGVFLALFILWRLFYHSFFINIIPKINLAIIGNNHKTEELLNEISKNPGNPFQLYFVFKDPEHIDNLHEEIHQEKIKAIVICDDFGDSQRMESALFSCLPYKIDFYNYPDFYELLSGKIPVEAIGQNWFLENLKEGQKNYYNIFKRIFDVVFATIILLITFSFWILIGLAIVVNSKGPVFFLQKRLGKNGKIFQIFKFRTMLTSANDGSPTKENDHRITHVGSFLRKARLDEIPQVINILSGSMSFIGPRPERPELVAELEQKIPFYRTRLLVKPGLTGWDQISGNYHSPSVTDTMEKLQHDLYYLKHRSLYLDMTIILKTFATVIFHEGR
ncbi:MAG: sugar transferase [Bacteroidales bacterium]|nr:sugar transferase [Bacteroidales bacterium]